MAERLEAIQKIRKLPKLKRGYIYEVSNSGGVNIYRKKNITLGIQLYYDFDRVVENQYSFELEEYINYFAKPISITKEKVVRTTETKIVGYE